MAYIKKLPSGSYQVQIRLKGLRPITKSFKLKKDATTFAKKVEGNDSVARALGDPIMTQTTLKDIIDTFKSEYNKKDPNILSRLKWWSDEFGTISIAQFNSSHVRQGISKLLKVGTRGKPLKPQTTNRFKAALSAAFTAYLDKDAGHKNPCRQVISKKEGDGRSRVFTNDDRAKFLNACKSSTWDQLYLFALMGFSSGSRRGELLKLRWMDCYLNSNNPYAICLDTKNGKDKTIYLNTDVVSELKKFKSARMGSEDGTTDLTKFKDITQEFVFRGVNGGYPYYRKSWISALKRAEIPETDANGERLGFHSCRHTFCTDLINADVDVSIVQKLAGHSNITTTQKYLHPNEDKKLDALKTFENIGVTSNG